MRFALMLFALVSSSTIGGSLAFAQSYPARPIHIVVPSGPGGTLDIIARKVGQKITESVKQPVIVENRPGASGILVISGVARAPADGYTIAIGTTGSFPMNFVARKTMPVHPIDDFAHISIVAESDYLLAVHPSVPAQNLRDFVALAQKQPGEITYSSFGPASASHFFTEAFSLAAGIKMQHIPYKSAPDGLQGLVSGQVNSAFDLPLVLAPQLQDGRLRALAMSEDVRSPLAPDVPTFSEAGFPGFRTRAWFAFFAPARTPPEIVRTLHLEIVKAVNSPALRKDLEAGGLKVVGGTPEQLVEQIREDIASYGEVAKAARIQLD